MAGGAYREVNYIIYSWHFAEICVDMPASPGMGTFDEYQCAEINTGIYMRKVMGCVVNSEAKSPAAEFNQVLSITMNIPDQFTRGWIFCASKGPHQFLCPRSWSAWIIGRVSTDNRSSPS